MTDYADWTKNLIADIRANGRPTSGYFEGRPVMVLTTTGAKSGQPREAVVSFSRDGDDYVVVARPEAAALVESEGEAGAKRCILELVGTERST